MEETRGEAAVRKLWEMPGTLAHAPAQLVECRELPDFDKKLLQPNPQPHQVPLDDEIEGSLQDLRSALLQQLIEFQDRLLQIDGQQGLRPSLILGLQHEGPVKGGPTQLHVLRSEPGGYPAQ